MAGNIKTLAAHLSISLAVLAAAGLEAANGAGRQDSDQGSKVGDVYIIRGHTGGLIVDGDEFGDAPMGEFGTVARPKTIVPGSGTQRGTYGVGAQARKNMANGSFGSPNIGRDPVANFDQAGVRNGRLGLQGMANGQSASAPSAGAALVGGTNVVPEGVYNQIGFGVTAAAINSADPFNRFVHENRPNMIDADAYNNQFVQWSYGLSSYYGGYGADSGYVPRENGYSPFVYDSSLYDRRSPSNFNADYTYSGYGSGAVENRRLTTAVAQPVVYEYSHPLSAVAAPPTPADASQVGTGFNAARPAFKAGDYAKALELSDQAIGQIPNDPALHEFRGLVLLALHRYEDAAAPFHATLSGGPDWDWQTLVGLYPNVSVYTQQLRALENYCNLNPRSASARFVLAYLYLKQGNTDVAVEQFKQVVALRPQDAVAARLIEQLE